jgi:hypothetical protein
MKTNVRVLTLVLFFSTLARGAEDLKSKFQMDLTKAEGQVEFLALAMPGELKIRGAARSASVDGPLFDGRIEGSCQASDCKLSGKIGFHLDYLKTGVVPRDRQMKKTYLSTGQFPRAVIELKDISASANGSAFEAALTLHGKTKTVKGEARLEKKIGEVSVALDFKLLLSDFDIATPTLLAVTVEPEISVMAFAHGPAEAR